LVAKAQRKEDPGAGDTPSQWVEDELQLAKARLHKLENELEQALKHVWSVDTDVRKLTESVSSSAAATIALEKLREDVRQLGDRMGKLQDRQNELGNRIDESLRQRQSESGRDRQELGAVSKQMEGIERGTQKQEARVQALEEALRHAEDEISSVKLAGQSLERSITEVAGKSERHDEGADRLGEQMARLAAQYERMEQEDARTGERLATLGEQLRRLSEKLDKLDDLVEFPSQVEGLMQRAAFERDQLSQRLNIIDRLSTEASEQVKAMQQSVALIEQRSQHQMAQMADIGSRLQDLEEQTAAELKKIVKVTLRQRRRQVEALSQEIKELTQGEPPSES
jgi:chromosome segregation ATPase